MAAAQKLPKTLGAITVFLLLLLAALPLATAHGDEHGGLSQDDGHAPTVPEEDANPSEPETYFRYGKQTGWILAHIVLMLLAWVIIMPLAVMIPRWSKYTLIAQLVFWIFAAPATLAGLVYSHTTPDLYPRNAHEAVGWFVLASAILWTLVPLYRAYSNRKEKSKWTAPSSNRSRAGYQSLHQDGREDNSLDSGIDISGPDSEQIGMRLLDKTSETSESDDEHTEIPVNDTSKNRLRHVGVVLISHSLALLQIILLPLGFLALGSGFVIYSGIAHDRAIFSFLAHAIKGAIFFFYGLLTLGRWMGAFAAFGWAWNLKKDHGTRPSWVPSAEFTESFVIWLYGASNVFLEHIAHWGGAWTVHDIEHLSITVLFFGGGLLGMLVESTWFRGLGEAAITAKRLADEIRPYAASGKQTQRPKISLNPIPGLVIMILGLMMSAHHQSSMTSTMLHAQWGTLFFVFALARAATYILLYIKPPNSSTPSRPPSELIASFCLICGGLVFILSATDVVEAIESNGIDAMAVFTVTAGCTCLIMAWEAMCFAGRRWILMREDVTATVTFG